MVRRAQIAQTNQVLPALKVKCTKPVRERKMTQTGRWIQRSAMPNASGVAAFIIAISHHAPVAVAVAMAAKSRFATASCCLNQTRRCTSASVRHAAADMDQMITTQLIGNVPVVDVIVSYSW